MAGDPKCGLNMNHLYGMNSNTFTHICENQIKTKITGYLYKLSIHTMTCKFTMTIT